MILEVIMRVSVQTCACEDISRATLDTIVEYRTLILASRVVHSHTLEQCMP